ncbi:4-hydroxyphenylpyruvate dioxygenase [Tanacetum coccineum]
MGLKSIKISNDETLNSLLANARSRIQCGKLISSNWSTLNTIIPMYVLGSAVDVRLKFNFLIVLLKNYMCRCKNKRTTYVVKSYNGSHLAEDDGFHQSAVHIEILDDELHQSAICSFFVWYSRFKLTSCTAAVNVVGIRNFKKEFENAFDGPVVVRTTKQGGSEGSKRAFMRLCMKEYRNNISEADLIKMERQGKRRVKAMRFPSSGNPQRTSLLLICTWPNQGEPLFSCSSAINGLTTSKDHTSVQINCGHLVESSQCTRQLFNSLKTFLNERLLKDNFLGVIQLEIMTGSTHPFIRDVDGLVHLISWQRAPKNGEGSPGGIKGGSTDFHSSIVVVSVDDVDIRMMLSKRAEASSSTSNNENVMMSLNEPVYETKRKSNIQTYLEHNEGTGVQHLALVTGDIFRTLKEMRKRSDVGGLEFMSAHHRRTLLQIFTKPVGDNVDSIANRKLPTIWYAIEHLLRIQSKSGDTFFLLLEPDSVGSLPRHAPPAGHAFGLNDSYVVPLS